MKEIIMNEIEQKQSEAWCISLLKLVSPSERAIVAKAIDVETRVQSERYKVKIKEIINTDK